MRPLKLLIVTWSLAIFSSVTYLTCILYGLIAPESLHMHQFLEILLPGYKWKSLPGFFVGLLESFLYGAYTGLVYVPIYNFLLRKWEGRN